MAAGVTNFEFRVSDFEFRVSNSQPLEKDIRRQKTRDKGRETRDKRQETVWYLLFISLFLPLTSYGQTAPRLETSFERDVNRYRWNAGLTIDQPIGAWRFNALNRFTSDAFILFNDLLSFRDENRLLWSMQHMENRTRITPQFRGNLFWYSQSRVLNQDVYAAFPISFNEEFSVEPALGVAMDQRPGAVKADGSIPLRSDLGPAFGGRMTLAPRAARDYNLRVDAGGNMQLITPRRGRLLRMNGSADRLFEETKLSSTFSYSNVRRDAYQSISFLNRDTSTNLLSETIEATTSDTLFVGLALETPIVQSLQLTSRLDFTSNNRKIRTFRAPGESLFFDTDFNRRSVDAEVGLLYQTRQLSTELSVQGGSEIEQRRLANRDELPPIQASQKGDLLEQADYDRSFLTLRTRNRIDLSSRLMLRAEGSVSILRHDTPLSNQDDRDESFVNGQLGIQYRFSPMLLATLNLSGSYFHTVYLKARRSAENNVQQALRLRPAVIWTPSRTVYLRVSSEVRATYTVDDFVLEGRRPTDQSAREIQYDVEYRQQLGNGLQLIGQGGVSDLRLGRFFQDSFAEIPFDTLQTFSGWVRIRSERRLTTEIGMRVFIRTDFERAATVRYRRIDESGGFITDEAGNVLRTTITRLGRRWIEQLGPTFSIAWPMRKASAVRLDGWLNVQHIRQRIYGDLPAQLVRHIRNEAWRGSRKIIPNLRLSVVWNL